MNSDPNGSWFGEQAFPLGQGDLDPGLRFESFIFESLNRTI